MIIRKEEVFCDYQTYRFGYAHFAHYEPGDKISEIYARGFLPMSRKVGDPPQFYETRSFRIPLHLFSPTSENRRVVRLFDGLYERIVTPAEKFDFKDPAFFQFCMEYMEQVLGLNGKEKLLCIFDTGFISDVVAYADRKSGERKGYVFLVRDDAVAHYWFSFYTLSLKKQSFGIWLMAQEIIAARESGARHMYLGTCYGQKGRYKMNFRPFEFWNGDEWVQDEGRLKKMCKDDEHPYSV